MEPYYSDDAVTIYHGDCRAVLPGLGWTDSVITDPPYGTGYYPTDSDAFTAEMLTKFVGMGPTAVFGWPERLVAYCVEARLVPDEWVTWWPTNAAIKTPPSRRLAAESECVAYFGDTAGFGLLTQPRTAKMQATYIGPNARGTSLGQPDTRRLGDVWTSSAPGIGAHSHQRQHPNEKPVAVLSRLVQATGAAAVLDPFMGSGTTLRAAKDLGCSAVGIEIEERFCEIAAKRMAQGVLDFG